MQNNQGAAPNPSSTEALPRSRQHAAGCLPVWSLPVSAKRARLVWDPTDTPQPIRKRKKSRPQTPLEGDPFARRRELNLDKPDEAFKILKTVSNLDLASQRYDVAPWVQAVVIAATIVDVYVGDESAATSTLYSLHGRHLADVTIQRDRRSVLRLVQMLDDLYLHWCQHSFAFELLIILSELPR